MQKIVIQGVEIVLSEAVSHGYEWLDYGDYRRLLEAAWLNLSNGEPPLNPRIVGEPGLGKTTLACATAQAMGKPVYIFQCTTDTRPEDLIITPVLGGQNRVEYRASSAVSAMVRGGVLILDEGNRMPEKSWASLAALLDERRYVDSTVAGIRVHADPAFRIAVTMNRDASVYELPSYIQSRLKPRLELLPPPVEVQRNIIRRKCPRIDDDLLSAVFRDLERRGRDEGNPRELLSLALYSQMLREKEFPKPFESACQHILDDPPES